MKIPRLILLTCFVFLFALQIKGQDNNVFNFNFNLDNGLPSNHVYTALVDRLGYLWFSTDKGVVKYNGYEHKVFNLSNGLSTTDVWQLFEDKKGRIWLGSISDELGYIFNDKYHRAYLKDINSTIYPNDFKNYKGGIIFGSPYINGKQANTYCYEAGDTIFKYCDIDLVSEGKSFLEKHSPRSIMVGTTNDNGEIFVFYEDGLYKVTGRNSLKRILTIGDTAGFTDFFKGHSFVMGNTIIARGQLLNRNGFPTLDIRSGQLRTINLSDYGDTCGIYGMLHRGDYLYVFTRSSVHVFVIGKAPKYVRSFSIEKYLPPYMVQEGNMLLFIHDGFWGNIVCTNSNGLYLSSELNNKFKKENDIDLQHYEHMGGIPGVKDYWWNSAEHTLAVCDDKMKFSKINLSYVKNIYSIAHYSKDSFIIFGESNYWLTAGLVCSPFLLYNYPGIRGGYVVNRDSLVVITLSGFRKFALNRNGIGAEHIIWPDRLKNIVFDSMRNSYWVYSNRKVFVHNNSQNKLISKEELLKFGINDIGKIVMDKYYGNVIFSGSINGNAKITVYDVEDNKHKELYKQFNLSGAFLFTYENLLITAGRFGVLVSKITGRLQVSKPIWYRNVKDVNYKYVYSGVVMVDKILLNTDKGVFTVPLPTDSVMLITSEQKIAPEYKFLINYQGNLMHLKTNDTIPVRLQAPKLQFDVINLSGNGKLKFAYKVNNSAEVNELRGDEFNFATLTPDNYYKISLFATDNVWRSDELNFYVYVQPLWWQTHRAIRLIWVFSLLGAILILVVAIAITQKMVIKNNRKKNLQMELELRSIYAQINPHFIFNTLNSALLLVSKNNMDQAYNHIAKFSKLLRSYIKSSRNRLILLDEEIVNLKNYIELQQVRFKDKFRYEIVADESVSNKGLKIPSLLLQPFVENAINHGLVAKNGAGSLVLRFHLRKDENLLTCTIEDDGIGRKEAAKMTERRDQNDESYGNLMIKDLVTIFRTYEKMKIDIDYIDKLAPLSGTIVTISIKYPDNGE